MAIITHERTNYVAVSSKGRSSIQKAETALNSEFRKAVFTLEITKKLPDGKTSPKNILLVTIPKGMSAVQVHGVVLEALNAG